MNSNLQLIQSKIYEIRGQKVMLDFDLAEMYGTETKRLKEAVRRNIRRFPADFMFVLTNEEYESLRTQFATSKGRGGTRYMPFAFTEQGVAIREKELASSESRLCEVKAECFIRNFYAINFALLLISSNFA